VESCSMRSTFVFKIEIVLCYLHISLASLEFFFPYFLSNIYIKIFRMKIIYLNKIYILFHILA
jgi:hypothetical protein